MQNATLPSFPELDGGFLMHMSVIIRTATPYFPKEAHSSLMFLSGILDFMSSFKLYAKWHIPLSQLPEMFHSIDYEALLNALKPCLSKKESDMVDAFFNFRQMSETWKTAMELSSILNPGSSGSLFSDMDFFSSNKHTSDYSYSESCSSASCETSDAVSRQNSDTDKTASDTTFSMQNPDMSSSFSALSGNASVDSFLSKEQLETFSMLKELLTQN